MKPLDLTSAIHPAVLRAIQHYRATGELDWTPPAGLEIPQEERAPINCAACRDVGIVAVPRADSGLTDYVDCDVCNIQRVKRARRLAHKVPLEFRAARLNQYVTASKTAQAKRVGMALKDWADSPVGSALVWGPFGGLKTTLMSAVWLHLVRSGIAQTAEWVTVPDLLAEIRRSFDHERGLSTLSDVIERVATADVALIDDLGAEYIKANNTAWVEEQLYRVINRRSNDQRTTLFTSNLSVEELGQRLGQRILSRIEGMCLPRIWQIDQGVDFRMIGRENEAAS